MSKNHLILYHGRCTDGFTCAWVLRKLYPEAEFRELNHGETEPEVIGRDVIMADFAYSRSTLERMHREARSFRVLDHHKTNEPEITGLDYVVFDLNRSGAGLTWDTYFPPKKLLWWNRNKRPWLVDYVEDRDLWRFAHKNSPDVTATISSYPKTFENWDLLEKMSLEEAAVQGIAIRRYQRSQVEAIAANARIKEFEGYKVPVVNSSALQSEIGSYLSKSHPLAIIWFLREDGKYIYSLRSSKEGNVNVGQLAKKHGGGGHDNAAGMQSDQLLF